MSLELAGVSASLKFLPIPYMCPERSPVDADVLGMPLFNFLLPAVLIVLSSFSDAIQAEKAINPSQESDWTPGKLTFLYPAVKHPRLRKLQKLVKADAKLRKEQQAFNRIIPLPLDLPVFVQSCGREQEERGAHYDGNKLRIFLCLESVNMLRSVLATEVKSERQLNTMSVWISRFVFYHELGHALVDYFELPILGREEDAVDEFATIALLSDDEQTIESALTVARSFYLLEKDELVEKEFPLWDTHSLSLQRSYNMVCLAYGSHPEQYTAFVGKKDGQLPEERAKNCEQEYQQKFKSWMRLLLPHAQRAM